MYSRELLKGILKPMILQLLSDHNKMHGYEMVKVIKEWSGGKILVKEGSLYPTLHALVKEELLTYEAVASGKRVRKYYKLSSVGKSRLGIMADEVRSFAKTLDTMFTPQKITV